MSAYGENCTLVWRLSRRFPESSFLGSCYLRLSRLDGRVRITHDTVLCPPGRLC